MYSENITEPIRAELKSSGVSELTTAANVHDFIKNMNGTATVLINSVCGCGARTARPGLFRSLNLPHKPAQAVSVFAGVDKEAISALREHLPGIPPSSPSFAFFRDGKLVHFIGRESIEGADESLLEGAIGLVHDKFFGDEINEALELKDTFELLERSPEELREHLANKSTTLLDCRAPAEREQGFIESSTPLDEALAQEILAKWDSKQDLTLYCEHGDLSLRAALYFRQNGFSNAFILSGGYKAWQ